MENLFETLGGALNPQKLTNDLTCTMCNVKQDHFCEIVYSQGKKVCLDCKNKNLESDNRAFDLDMSFR
jgi:hypothetical protein